MSRPKLRITDYCECTNIFGHALCVRPPATTVRSCYLCRATTGRIPRTVCPHSLPLIPLSSTESVSERTASRLPPLYFMTSVGRKRLSLCPALLFEATSCGNGCRCIPSGLRRALIQECFGWTDVVCDQRPLLSPISTVMQSANQPPAPTISFNLP